MREPWGSVHASATPSRLGRSVGHAGVAALGNELGDASHIVLRDAPPAYRTGTSMPLGLNRTQSRLIPM